ncbi:SDR family oxidoreductase [Secundilactobacillus folii]|uniref:SDR family NAD(P)-dependent oxidoreductase n=1 Tax=Secundilactobacillus folii TaxID=2678357 RepID=A0A7X3C2K8_9LACO|nr:SDR family oxidoreductase [Secundilactobacillus folii]MTV81927.1 SDR family NAD(P)-dependent oxidoreductase [Secundilactobacillus folii]
MPNKNYIESKVVIIMGASSGIGEATARRLAKDGAKVIISARREDRLEKLADSLSAYNVKYQVGDVRVFEDVQAVINTAMTEYGRIDVLYNNAGIMPLNPLSKLRLDEWQAMLDTNIMGVLNGIAAVLPIMEKQGSGQILATDSVAGHVVEQTSAVYAGTKFAVRAIMEGLRKEEKDMGIRSTIISPGLVDTELYTTVDDEDTQAYLKQKAKIDGLGLNPETVANAVAYAINQPEGATVTEVFIRPTRQEG